MRPNQNHHRPAYRLSEKGISLLDALCFAPERALSTYKTARRDGEQHPAQVTTIFGDSYANLERSGAAKLPKIALRSAAGEHTNRSDSRAHIGHRPDPSKTAETIQPASGPSIDWGIMIRAI
jgi:hypothetical protein